MQEGCGAREWRAGEVCCEHALVRTEYLRGALVAGASGARLLSLSGAALRDVLGCALGDYKSPSSSRRRAYRLTSHSLQYYCWPHAPAAQGVSWPCLWHAGLTVTVACFAGGGQRAQNKVIKVKVC